MRHGGWDVLVIISVITLVFMILALMSHNEKSYQKAYDEGFNAAMEEVAKETFDNKYVATKLKEVIILTPRE